MKTPFGTCQLLTFIIREFCESLAAFCTVPTQIDVGVKSVYAARRLLGLCL